MIYRYVYSRYYGILIYIILVKECCVYMCGRLLTGYVVILSETRIPLPGHTQTNASLICIPIEALPYTHTNV